MEPANINVKFSDCEIEQWLTAAIGRACNTDPQQIDKKMMFTEFGLDSIAAIEIVGDLEEWLHCRLPETLLWDYPTISELAQYCKESLCKNSDSTQRPESLIE